MNYSDWDLASVYGSNAGFYTNPSQPYILPTNQTGSWGEFSSVGNPFNGSIPDGVFSNGYDWSSGFSFDTSALSSSFSAPSYTFDSLNSWGGYGGFDSGSFYDYGFSYTPGSFYNFSLPVVLDLNGDGVSLTELDQSTTFFDMAGDGRQHRTAWAGAGDGVLAFDANGDGKITQRNEIVFTDWDPTAANDVQALLNVFDTNKDGKLGAGDADIAKFGVLVVDKNGESTFKSLSAAGVASIALREDQFRQAFADGSSIDGEMTFTKTDGTTGKAATVTLAYDADGRTVATTTTANGDGSTTIVKATTNPDGGASGKITANTSANGRIRVTTIDQDGDGVVEERQRDETVVAGDGSKTRTVTISDAANVVLSKTTTTTSADGRTDTILHDTDGNGVTEQREVVTRAATGVKTVTVTDLNPNGSTKAVTTHSTSANGQTGTTQINPDGDADYDLKRVTTVALTATTKTETVTETNIDATKRSQVVTTSSLDGATQTVQIDADGDGAFEAVKSSAKVKNGDNSVTTTETLKGSNGTTVSVAKTTISATGLVIKTETDVNGDGVFDETTLDSTVIAANGNQTQTIVTTNAAGAKVDQTVIAKNANGVTRTTNTDTDGDGKNDVVATVVKASSGVVTETTSTYALDASVLLNKTVVTTSADGLTKTTDAYVNGDTLLDAKTVAATVKNANGSSTVTTTNRDRNGALLTQTVTTTSADGLTRTTSSNVDGAGAFDYVDASTTIIAADKSETTTATTKSANGKLLAKTVTKLSVDRNRTDVAIDANGDGKDDLTQVTIRAATGIVTDTVKTFTESGLLTSSVVTTTSANGLTKTVVTDIEGDGATDETVSDATVLNNDGGKTRTVTVLGAAGALRSKTVSTTDDTGLSVTTQSDLDGSGTFDVVTTDVTALGVDSGRTRTVTSKTGSGATTGSVVTTTSGNGLQVTTKTDADGDADFDTTKTDVTVLAGNGTRTRTVTNKNVNGTLRDEVVTATSADRKTVTVSSNLDGKGGYDNVVTTVTSATGKVTETEVATEGATTIYKRIRETAPDGLSWTETADANGNGTIDQTRGYSVTINANGSKTEVATDDNTNDNVLLGWDGNTANVTTTTSADGLRKDIVVDGNNAGFPIDREFHSIKTINADGSTRETLNSQYTNGSTAYYLSRQRITESADHDTRVVEIDLNGQTVGSSPAFKASVRTETVVAATGVTTETYSQFKATGALHSKTVTTTSADGQDVTVQRDLEGDNAFDLVKTSKLETDGSRTETMFWYSGFNDNTRTTTSADGRTKTTQYDFDGDSVYDSKTTQVSAIAANGSTTDTRSDYNANGTLRSRVATTTSANGLSVTGAIDLNGDGVVDENYSNVTALSDDGGKVATVMTKYADTNALKNKTVTTTSADGRSVKTEEDFDGDGKVDVLREDSLDASGDKTSAVTYYKNGVKQSKDVAIVNADGALTRVTRDFNGDGVTDYVSREGHVSDGTGSYDIAAADAWTPHFEANHWIDENGVDHMRIQVDDADEYTRTLTADQHSEELGMISRIYDVLLDRDVTTAEQQGYIKRTSFGVTIDDVMASAEFKDKYGTLTSAQFVQRVYENAFGRGPKLNELNEWVGFLASAPNDAQRLIYRRDMVYTLAESALHLTAGNTHAVTNNSRTVSGKITLDRTTDRLVAENAVEGLFQTMLDQSATAAEKANWGGKILNGSNTEAQIANAILAADFKTKYGTLTNEQFVTRLFQNGLDRAPTGSTTGELATWKAKLDSGAITRADLVLGVAESPDFFSAQGAARTGGSSASTMAASRQSNFGGDNASMARMIQAMSVMSANDSAASSLTTQPDQSQTHQLAVAHA